MHFIQVKCDERKPTCLRCSDRRLKCPGYPTNALKWSAKHEVHKSCESAPTPTINHPIIASAIGYQGLTRGNRTHDGYDNYVNPTVQQDHHYAEPADFYELPSPIFDTSRSSSYPGSHETTSTEVRPVEKDAGSSAELLITDSPFTTIGTPFDLGQCPTSAESTRCVSWQDYNDEHSVDNADTSYYDLTLGDGSATDTLQRSTSVQELGNTEASAVLPLARTGTARSHSFSASLSPTILHVPTVLVEYYFRNVCRECSTFDSSYNPFRSTVAEMQFNSAPLNYAIQSLAASKLADDMPLMRITGIEAQGKALEHLKRESMAADGLQNVSEEVLCTILLLGMTTSWHVREDIGVEYLVLAHRIIMAKSQAHNLIAKPNLEFYQNALKYWTMIVSIVSDRAGDLDQQDEDLNSAIGPLPSPTSAQLTKIMPHPWTGISPTPQQLFGQVLQLVRKTRLESKRKQSSGYSRAGIASIFNAITTAERLEARCWSLPIPLVDDIKDTEDTSTPPIHHVLTAKAYLLSALLHIYMMFPDVLDSRIQTRSVAECGSPVPEVDSQNIKMLHAVSVATVWPQRSSEDPHELWLRDLGLCIVECLENIDVKSGTRVVHPPLLLSVASALVFINRKNRLSKTGEVQCMDRPSILGQIETANPGQSQSVDDLNARVRQCRTFVVNRLETMHALMRFHAIDNILKVVKEVWRRADSGSQDIFWMDIMHELRCESLFG